MNNNTLKLSDISKISIECQSCNTQTIIEITPELKTIEECPLCKRSFRFQNWEYQKDLYRLVNHLKDMQQKVHFKVVCDE